MGPKMVISGPNRLFGINNAMMINRIDPTHERSFGHGIITSFFCRSLIQKMFSFFVGPKKALRLKYNEPENKFQYPGSKDFIFVLFEQQIIEIQGILYILIGRGK